jgi:serine/threonine protein kinase
MADKEWNTLMKELKTSEGLGGQSTIEINKDRTQIRKIFNKKDRKYYFIEKEILQKLDHPTIIKVIDYDDNSHTLYFDFYEKGTAFKHYIKNNVIKIHDIDVVMKIFNDLLQSLMYLYRTNITHRDIKLENILMDDNDNHILCDFGLARVALTKMTRVCGTYNYMAPEMWYLDRESENNKYTYKVDIFSLGALIIEIVNGESLFYDEYRCRFKRVYKELGKFLSEDNDEYNERKIFSDIWYSDDGWLRLKDIMKQMIEPDPIKRITYEDILKELNYPDS